LTDKHYQALETYTAAREESRKMPPTATAPGAFPRVLALRAWGFKRELNHFKASLGITPTGNEVRVRVRVKVKVYPIPYPTLMLVNAVWQGWYLGFRFYSI